MAPTYYQNYIVFKQSSTNEKYQEKLSLPPGLDIVPLLFLLSAPEYPLLLSNNNYPNKLESGGNLPVVVVCPETSSLPLMSYSPCKRSLLQGNDKDIYKKAASKKNTECVDKSTQFADKSPCYLDREFLLCQHLSTSSELLLTNSQ